MSATPTIQTPADMAALLRRSCPDDAAQFAGTTYRRACGVPDEGWAEFWHGVVAILTADPGLSPASPA